MLRVYRLGVKKREKERRKKGVAIEMGKNTVPQSYLQTRGQGESPYCTYKSTLMYLRINGQKAVGLFPLIKNNNYRFSCCLLLHYTKNHTLQPPPATLKNEFNIKCAKCIT